MWLQHHDTKEWYTQATIISPRAGGSYVIKTDSGKEYIRGRRFVRPVKNTPSSQTAISRRLHITTMPCHSKYRDTEERIKHYDNLRRWDNRLQVLPFTTSLREIRDVQHFYNGIPIGAYMCFPGQTGVDQKPELRDTTDVGQPHREQPGRAPPIFSDGRRSQHDPRTYSSWYRNVVGLDRLESLPQIRGQEGGQGTQGHQRPTATGGRTTELQRRQRRQLRIRHLRRRSRSTRHRPT